ncbi:MAG: M20 family metallo-hydrolase [Proteobacteria bacterium]|nr:M20 family metallo-hydrolase [Pseudomonadota bacterium]
MNNLRIDIDRLMRRIRELGKIGAIDGGGVCRLALSDEDKAGRDMVMEWMRQLGLAVSTDKIGNVVGVRPGSEPGEPVMTGSHIDTVATGGIYDGNLGVLAGLEVVAVLNDAGVVTKRPIAVGFFTNEEGARFAPDMMGSGVHQGALDLDECLDAVGIGGSSVRDNLERIGHAGDQPVGKMQAHSFFELHVEQGPLLEEEGITIGAVTGVQGISWTEYTIKGVSNHAGTTPMRLRHDAGYAAAAIATEARRIADDMGGNQVATSGVITLKPNLINVIAKHATVTVDLRNTDEALLQTSEQRMQAFVADLGTSEGVDIAARTLARFEPVAFDEAMIDLVEATAQALGCSVRRMPSGAGHDAQMFAPNCQTAMIFVPSKGGISHNVREYTAPEEIKVGADVLLQVMLANAE